jgi:hypothetical protein
LEAVCGKNAALSDVKADDTCFGTAALSRWDMTGGWLGCEASKIIIISVTPYVTSTETFLHSEHGLIMNVSL